MISFVGETLKLNAGHDYTVLMICITTKSLLLIRQMH